MSAAQVCSCVVRECTHVVEGTGSYQGGAPNYLGGRVGIVAALMSVGRMAAAAARAHVQLMCRSGAAQVPHTCSLGAA